MGQAAVRPPRGLAWLAACAHRGNGAADQLQLDIYGEALDSIAHADSRSLRPAHQDWMALTRITDWVYEHWDQPEEGIWETRGGRKYFSYGRLQCWVALIKRMLRISGRRIDLCTLLGMRRPDPTFLRVRTSLMSGSQEQGICRPTVQLWLQLATLATGRSHAHDPARRCRPFAHQQTRSHHGCFERGPADR
jgi:hypothetical protein